MRIAVVGGGPAGMMAAIAAGEQGADVTLFDGNEKLGKKLLSLIHISEPTRP